MNSFLKQQILAMDTNAYFPNLIDITYYDNIGNVTHYYYNDSDSKLVYKGNTYEPMLMSVQGGKKEESGIGDGSLSLSDVDRVWTERIRNTKNRPECTHYECAVYDSGDGMTAVEAVEQTSYKLKEASYDGQIMSFTMVFDENMSIVIPPDTGNPQLTSGCS